MLRLSGDFAGTNASVATSLDGVQFGPYPDGGQWGGSVRYSGLTVGPCRPSRNSRTGSCIRLRTAHLPLSHRRTSIFLDGDTHDVVFDPSECATATPEEDEFVTFDVTGTGYAPVRRRRMRRSPTTRRRGRRSRPRTARRSSAASSSRRGSAVARLSPRSSARSACFRHRVHVFGAPLALRLGRAAAPPCSLSRGASSECERLGLRSGRSPSSRWPTGRSCGSIGRPRKLAHPQRVCRVLDCRFEVVACRYRALEPVGQGCTNPWQGGCIVR